MGWSLDQKDPWEEEMAPHSSILIWKMTVLGKILNYKDGIVEV